MTTLTYTGTLEVTTCWCGIAHAIPSDLMRQASDKGTTVWCPLGHQWVVRKSEADRLRESNASLERQLSFARASRDAAEDQARAAERSKVALKGHLTRARNKIAAGTCPAPECGQHFSNVREHMKHKHPDFHLIDPETGKVAAL